MYCIRSPHGGFLHIIIHYCFKNTRIEQAGWCFLVLSWRATAFPNQRSKRQTDAALSGSSNSSLDVAQLLTHAQVSEQKHGILNSRVVGRKLDHHHRMVLCHLPFSFPCKKILENATELPNAI